MNIKHFISTLSAPHRLLFPMALGLGTISLVPNASAASLILDDSAVDSCTTLNCGSVFINSAHSERNQFGDSVPFTAEIWADKNVCLRLDVTHQGINTSDETANLKMVLVSPSGAIWRNDDRVVGDNRPLITARTDVQGHYTVQVNHYNGSFKGSGIDKGFYENFGLAFGRYVPGTANNCPTPSPKNF